MSKVSEIGKKADKLIYELTGYSSKDLKLNSLEEREVIIKAQAGDMQAQRKLIESNLRGLFYYGLLALDRYKSIKDEDLFYKVVVSGCEKIAECIRNFDLTGNLTFDKYVSLCLNNFFMWTIDGVKKSNASLKKEIITEPYSNNSSDSNLEVEYFCFQSDREALNIINYLREIMSVEEYNIFRICLDYSYDKAIEIVHNKYNCNLYRAGVIIKSNRIKVRYLLGNSNDSEIMNTLGRYYSISDKDRPYLDKNVSLMSIKKLKDSLRYVLTDSDKLFIKYGKRIRPAYVAYELIASRFGLDDGIIKTYKEIGFNRGISISSVNLDIFNNLSRLMLYEEGNSIFKSLQFYSNIDVKKYYDVGRNRLKKYEYDILRKNGYVR